MTDRPNSTVTSLKARRASKPKVRTGCQKCKQRRVKCDESKPTCLRCERSNLECSGYGIFLPFKRHEPVSSAESTKQLTPAHPPPSATALVFYRGLDAFAQLADGQNAAYDFCRTRTVYDLATLHCDHFWNTSVLSGCHHEPAILYAVLALGSAHRAFIEQPKGSSIVNQDAFPEVAYLHYGKAVQHLQSRCTVHDADHLRVVLIVCVILLCFDLMTQRRQAAWLHFEHGRKVLCLLKKQTGSADTPTFHLPQQTESIEDELVYSFTQLDLQATNFGGKVPQFNLVLDPAPDGIANMEIPSFFATVSDAGRHMIVLLNEGFKLRGLRPDPKVMNPSNKAAVAKRNNLMRRLAEWEIAFDNGPFHALPSFLDLRRSSSARQSLVLRMQHAFLSINVASCLSHGEEEQYDDYLNHYVTIVSTASTLIPHLPVFKLDMAIIQPLYVVAKQCRHPVLRRQAIDIMWQTRREGLWDTEMIEAGARAVIEVEEADSDYVYDSGKELTLTVGLTNIIPVAARVSEMYVFYAPEGKYAIRIILRRNVKKSGVCKPSILREYGIVSEDGWEEIERYVSWNAVS